MSGRARILLALIVLGMCGVCVTRLPAQTTTTEVCVPDAPAGVGTTLVSVTLRPSSTTTTTRLAPTTLRPTSTTTTTTTLRPTTTTTILCRRRGQSCVLNAVKHPELCCSKRCGGAKKCR